MAEAVVDPVQNAGESRVPMSIHDLPTEIVLLVLDYISSFELDAFTSTCKRWRAIAETRLAEHGRLKKRYTNVILQQHPRQSESHSPDIFLDALQKKPEHRFYPCYLSLDKGLNLDLFHGGIAYEFIRDTHENVRHKGTTYECFCNPTESERDSTNIVRCLLKTYPSDELAGQWSSPVSGDSSEDSRLAFLLTSLPNLRELRVPWFSKLRPGSTLILQVFSTASTATPAHINVLARFQTVKTTDRCRSVHSLAEVTSRRRHHLSLLGGKNSLDDPWGITRPPRLEGFNLKASGIGDPALRSLLEFNAVLRVFRYLHTSSGSPGVIHPNSISSALMKYNSKTLTELCLGMSESVKVSKPVVTLRWFLTLNRLEISPDLFICPSTGAVTKLVAVLPASIEVIGLREPGKLVKVPGLTGPKEVRAAEAIFQGLRLKERRARVPKMATLELATPHDRWKSVISALSALVEKMSWRIGYFDRELVEYSF